MDTDLNRRVLLLLRQIPKGKVASYKELAAAAGTWPRVIGRIMASNPDPVNYPCYKVVGSDGRLIGYSGRGGLSTKRKLLEKDGIKLVGGKIDKKHFYEFE